MNGQVMLGELMLGHNSDVAEFSQCSNFTKFVDVIAFQCPQARSQSLAND